MYSASSGSVQPLPTSTWYKYSSWPKDSSTSLRPQFGLYIPHFVLERGGERERWGWVVPVSNYPHIRGNMLKRITCGLARRLTKLYGCWCQPGTDVFAIPHPRAPPIGSLRAKSLHGSLMRFSLMRFSSMRFSLMRLSLMRLSLMRFSL